MVLCNFSTISCVESWSAVDRYLPWEWYWRSWPGQDGWWKERISLSCDKDSWMRWSGCKERRCRTLWSGLFVSIKWNQSII